MLELLQNGTFVFWTSITLICVVPVIAHHWYKVRRAEIDASLKRDMLERGMCADEIQKVLQASSKSREPAEKE